MGGAKVCRYGMVCRSICNDSSKAGREGRAIKGKKMKRTERKE